MRACMLVVVAVLLLHAAPAHAVDWCFNSTSPPNPAPTSDPDILVVAQRFKTPRKGQCQAIVGYDIGYSNSTFPRPASGTACVDSAGTRMHVGIVIHATKGPAPINTDAEIHVHMNLPYPALTGGEVYIRRDVPLLAQVRSDGLVGRCGFPIPIP